MYIHFLGTGTGGSPGSRRWRAANLVDTGEYLVVVDCGVGCHYRLSDRGLLTEVDYVFITHSHMDHFLGLPEALFQAHIEGRTRPLYIYAPRVWWKRRRGSSRLISSSLRVTRSYSAESPPASS